MAEDKAVLIRLMRGLNSHHHWPGPLAPADLEGPVLDFYRYIGSRLVPFMGSAGRATA
jgi:hypothetical protein